MPFAASTVGALPAQFGQIFYTIVLPILLMVGVGWILERRLGLDIVTLQRLNFYFTMPALIFYSVVTSSLTTTVSSRAPFARSSRSSGREGRQRRAH